MEITKKINPLGFTEYYYQNQLIKQEKKELKYAIYYEENKIFRINMEDVYLYMDDKGNITEVYFLDGIKGVINSDNTISFIYKNQLLGIHNLKIEPITSFKQYFYLKKIINQLFKIHEKYQINDEKESIEQLDEEITKLNNLLTKYIAIYLQQSNPILCLNRLKSMENIAKFKLQDAQEIYNAEVKLQNFLLHFFPDFNIDVNKRYEERKEEIEAEKAQNIMAIEKFYSSKTINCGDKELLMLNIQEINNLLNQLILKRSKLCQNFGITRKKDWPMYFY